MSTQRKHYLIDKKFQLKTTLDIVGIVTILAAVILGTISFSVLYNNEKIKNIYAIESSIMDYFSSGPAVPSAPEYIAAFDEQMKNHTNNMKTLNSIIEYNRILIIALLLLVVIQGIVLYILLIRKTHKISGPLNVMSQYMCEVIDGKIPVTRPLREKDDLKEFYQLFNEMLDSMKKKDS